MDWLQNVFECSDPFSKVMDNPALSCINHPIPCSRQDQERPTKSPASAVVHNFTRLASKSEQGHTCALGSSSGVIPVCSAYHSIFLRRAVSASPVPARSFEKRHKGSPQIPSSATGHTCTFTVKVDLTAQGLILYASSSDRSYMYFHCQEFLVRHAVSHRPHSSVKKRHIL